MKNQTQKLAEQREKAQSPELKKAIDKKIKDLKTGVKK
jgi:hypothetical protein